MYSILIELHSNQSQIHSSDTIL